MNKDYYLKTELYEIIQKDSIIFDFLQENSLDGIWYWDLENPENEWLSPKFWKVLGYSFEEKKHLTSEWQELIFYEDLEKTIDNFNKHYKNPEHPYDQIVRYKHKKGHTLWIRCRGSIIRDNNGKPIRMIGIHNDVTKQKTDEERLLEKANSLKAILDSSLDGIMAFDSFYNKDGEIIDFIFTMSNKEACKIVNLSEEQLIGQRLSKIQPGNFKQLDSLNGRSLFDNYKEVVLTGEAKSLEFYFESDGIKEWFRNKTVKYNNGFICTFEIITSEKDIKENLNKELKKKLRNDINKKKYLFNNLKWQ